MGSVHVGVARVGDRNHLLSVLRDRGLEPRELADDSLLGFEIPCDEGDPDRICADVLAEMETIVAESGLPLVPVKAEGAVFLRPPAT